MKRTKKHYQHFEEPTKGTELTAPTTTEANQMATMAPPP